MFEIIRFVEIYIANYFVGFKTIYTYLYVKSSIISSDNSYKNIFAHFRRKFET